MKLLREFCEIVESYAGVFLLTGVLFIALLISFFTYHQIKMKHEYKMELLKQGKVSIESIK
jgi:hypothetical protein